MRVVVIVALLLLTACEKSNFDVWLKNQSSDCFAQKGRMTYNSATLTASCYRTPFMRHPKKVFERTFTGNP